MSDSTALAVQYRSLLTDTLPYEVPVIFSNDRFHASVCLLERAASTLASDTKLMLKKLFGTSQGFTIPYSYSIAKDSHRTTILGIIHPRLQREIANFYETHSGSMLNYCANGQFSLRRPVEAASPFTEGKIAEDSTRLRIGVVDQLAALGEPDVSHMTSYFVYGKYNLLGKFVASREFLRLEARFLLCRTLDISKCFFNIYTHTISWAVKDKAFAKANTSTYSFELQFDRIMQRSNYNETNGIVVGPEVSRIFAEIFLQDVDRNIARELGGGTPRAIPGRDYDIRRYVDDYYVFANSAELLDRIESATRKFLGEYKLHLNERKIVDMSRPFVSNLTLARHKIDELFTRINAIVSDAEHRVENVPAIRAINQIKEIVQALRAIVSEREIDFANVSGWIVSRLRGLCRRCVRLVAEHPNEDRRKLFGDFSIALLEVVLYLCAVDTRVRTTYSLCQIVLLICEQRDSLTEIQRDTLEHVITEECANILKILMSRRSVDDPGVESIEIYNLLICGANFLTTNFVSSAGIREHLATLHALRPLRYFRFITLRFCYLRAPSLFKIELDDLHSLAISQLTEPDTEIERDSENHLMLCDILSSGDRPAKERRQIFVHFFGGNPSKAAIDALVPYVGFSDWTGLSVEHLLRRKELRPVYAWS